MSPSQSMAGVSGKKLSAGDREEGEPGRWKEGR